MCKIMGFVPNAFLPGIQMISRKMNRPDLGWLREIGKEVRYAWVAEKNRSGTQKGKVRGVEREKEDKMTAMGIEMHSCIDFQKFEIWFLFLRRVKWDESGANVIKY